MKRTTGALSQTRVKQYPVNRHRRAFLSLTSRAFGAAVALSNIPLSIRRALAAPPAVVTVSPAQVKRIVEGLRVLDDPLPSDMGRVLALSEHLDSSSVAKLEEMLDKYTLIRVRLDKHGFGESAPGGANRQLLELGWRTFLVRVENPGKLTGPLILASLSQVNLVIPEGELQIPIHDRQPGNDVPETISVVPNADPESISKQWMGFRLGGPTMRGLEGAPLEYQLLQIYSQAGGSRTAFLSVCWSAASNIWSGAQSEGFTAEFKCPPASTIALGIRDWDGMGTTASFLIHDEAGRLYPAPAHRLEPDVAYRPQIYRADGERIRSPAGRYKIMAWRGPEYHKRQVKLIVPPGGAPVDLKIDLVRWIDPGSFGWYGGGSSHPCGWPSLRHRFGPGFES